MNNCEKSGESQSLESRCEKEDEESNSNKNSNSDFDISRGSLVITQRNPQNFSESQPKFKSRTGGNTHNDFRMARGGGNSERGGRGGSSRGRVFKKVVDRDANFESGHHYATKSKSYESVKNQENSQGKYDDKKFYDDSRVSKLLRRLGREDDYEHFIGICKQLQESILAPENVKYIKRCLDFVCENLLDSLRAAPGSEAKQQVSKCLARVGFIADQDTKKYISWIFSKYSTERRDDIKCHLIKSIGETLKMDTEGEKFKDNALSLMSHLQSTLENVNRSDLFYATVDVILVLGDAYPDTFADYFRNTVDILVGWHIDPTQKKSVIAFTSRSLQKLRDFWLSDFEFTLTLLSQFLEDMENYGKELSDPDSGRSSPEDEPVSPPRENILQITSMISVFNTVTKSVSENLNPNVNSYVQWPFLSECLDKMLKTVLTVMRTKQIEDLQPLENNGDEGKTKVIVESENWDLKLGSYLCQEKEDLVLVANECTFLLVSHLQSHVGENHEFLYTFIDFQLANSRTFSNDTVLSTLRIISKIIKEVSTNLPLELVHKVLDKDSVLLKMRFWNSTRMQNAALAVYHSLLSLKNIPLLQEAYRYILAELEIASNAVLGNGHVRLVEENPMLGVEWGSNRGDFVIVFLLRALSDIGFCRFLANASNSIIGMWALQPSILELLAVKLKPSGATLSVKCPLLQYNILYLLCAHSSRYNHFVTSSTLITKSSNSRSIEMFPRTLEVPTMSPTSGHLSIVLNLISQILENTKISPKILLLTLKWLREISIQAENSLGVLMRTDEYSNLLQKLVICGSTANRDIALAVCENFQVLLTAKDSFWTQGLYVKVVDLAVLHLTSMERNVRESYANLLISVPLNVVLPRVNKEYLFLELKKMGDIHNYSLESLISAQKLYMRNNGAEMQPQHFRTYMAYLLQNHNFDNNNLLEIFMLCWSTISGNENATKIFKKGLTNSSVAYFWAGFEAAQHCVQSKLRTVLGKPQETFTAIEGALKSLAREITTCVGLVVNTKNDRDPGQNSNQHARVRSLVEFLEHLERVIYNASEGCAVALLPLPKPVRSFFHTNRSTCREWLNRIRLALCVVSLHAGLATNALRNGERLLEDLKNSDNVQSPEFERAVLCTAQAMLILGEAEALQGLYVHTKELDRKFPWLKAVIEEAAGHYEVAAEIYRQFLQDQASKATKIENDSPKSAKTEIEMQVTAFCMNQITKCYQSTADWSKLELWKFEEDEMLKAHNSPTPQKPYMTIPQIQSMKIMEKGEELSLLDLSDWTLLDKDSKTNWSCGKSISECSNTLQNIALRINIDDAPKEMIIQDIQDCQKVAAQIMEEGLRNVPSEHLNDSFLLQYSSTGLLNHLNENSQKNVFELFQTDKINNLSTKTLTQILWWSEYFSKLTNSGQEEVESLRLHVIRNARKDGNFGLAKRQITKFFANEVLGCGDFGFEEVVDVVTSGKIHGNFSRNTLRAFRETSKVLYRMDKTEEAVSLCSITALGISQNIVEGTQLEDSIQLREAGTKLLLTLSKWLQQPQQDIKPNLKLEVLMKFESLHNDGLMDKLFGKTTDLIPSPDMMIGKLVHLGVNQCPDLPLAWANFAAWCYKWGRKIVDCSTSGQLTEDDESSIRNLLLEDVSHPDFVSICSILGQKKHLMEDEGDIEINDVNTSEMIENQLRSISILNNASNEYLAMLIEIWRKAQKRVYSYYELSANAYFKFLQLARKDTNECVMIVATLRLLRLIVKHALELQNVLELGLSMTPTEPWKEIIPQLFSRLSHPEAYVRTRVSELLCRVALNSPHLVVFPSVVGVVSGKKRKSYSFGDKEEDSNSSEPGTDLIECNDANDGFLNSCFAQLNDCLSRKNPDSVNQVNILVKELRRITMLWDELWLSTLCQHHSDITSKFVQLEIEVQKVQDNAWLTNEEKEKLIVEKNRIILKPIVFILENLVSVTISVPAETPHEKAFQARFSSSIKDVIEKFENPKNPSKPRTTLDSLKHLQTKLSQRVNKRGVYTLQMSDISPVLANLKNTCIAMPGINLVDNKVVTVKSVYNNVQVLPTKTKPKKLVFQGSDGRIYTYLFKSLEDLHLDERIMQFLSTCNTMMSKNNDGSKKIYRARHYSVIPLGPRSGLIQWVDGVTPLFAIYKRWQQKDCANIGKSSNSTVLRPSDLFYNKLTPLLKERGITLENRKEWPLAVLKQVLTELMNETPKDLLAKEIWCNSINSGSWWQATKNYSCSVAVMSIIGYIIGLGDRHLDNVLVNLNTGQVVHIDYNVCFEKGKTLRVPEKVPFRMTPNIITALGVTGVEGIFRLACENTLRVMRRGRETLLTLLEAFVYDPLIDWRAGAENTIETYGVCQSRTNRSIGFDRRELELEMTHAMFAVRMKEMRTEWLSNRDELVKILPLLRHHLNCWIETTQSTQQCQDLIQDRHQQLALIKEAQAMGRNHNFYSVIKRYQTHKRAKEAHENAKIGLQEKIEECQKHISMHNMALSAIRGPQINQWIVESTNQQANQREDHMVFELVKEFLQNAGQGQMVVQCEQSENEVTQLAIQESILIKGCLELLNQYSQIYSLYPLSVKARHRSIVHQAWAKNLLVSGTADDCRNVLTALEDNLTTPQQHIVSYSYQMQTNLARANEKFKKAYDRVVSEGLLESSNRTENAYTESKSQIVDFVHREKSTERAFECVKITHLCTLNQRYLVMEGAAKSAGDCLANLTLREGEWFLDEMRFMTSLITELITLVPESHEPSVLTDPNVSQIIQCLKSADLIFKGLQELNYNFHTIILPEAMNYIITEEPSVMRMIAELDEIIVSIGFPLNDILRQLEIHFRLTILDTENSNEVIRKVVAEIRLRFNSMFSGSLDERDLTNEDKTLTPGQMLLMGFNGLFENLQAKGRALINNLTYIDVPSNWKKIDQIREAKELSAHIFKATTRNVLEDIFLIKRLVAIQNFFLMCRETSNAFKGNPANVYDDERLDQPVRVFTADYVSRQVLGLMPQTLAISLCFLLQHMGLNVTREIEQRDIGAESKVSLEDLCRKAVDSGLKRGLFTRAFWGQANVLSSSLESAWRRKLSARLAQRSMEMARSSVQRIRFQLTAYQWLHEDCLVLRTSPSTSNLLNRSTFMLELRKNVAALSTTQSRICESREQQKNLVVSSIQRLKWASGANPALGEVMSAFDSVVLVSGEKLTCQQNLAAVVVNTCNAILHYEALRTKTSESVNNDANFAKVIKHWQEICTLVGNLSIGVSLVEEKLVELLVQKKQPMEGNVDANWLKQAEKIVQETIVDAQNVLQEHQSMVLVSQESLKETILNLQGVMLEHHRLMTDVRELLRSMVKQQDATSGLHDFLVKYRVLTESVTNLVKELQQTENLSLARAMNMDAELEFFEVNMPPMYDELMYDSAFCEGEEEGGKKGPKAKVVRQESFSPKKGVRDPTTGKVSQERNAYALNVWRRVRMKLEGRDPNPSRKFSTAEQVEFVIREAQNTENLALLYEGWTPWV